MSKSKSGTASERGNGPASLAKGVSLHMEGKLDAALQEINRALEGGDESPEVYLAKAQIQFELEQYQDAAKSYAKLLTVSPRHAAASFNLAICMERLGKWQEAAEHFKRATSLEKIYFVLFDNTSLSVFEKALREIKERGDQETGSHSGASH